jgi:hypothetical protein
MSDQLIMRIDLGNPARNFNKSSRSSESRGYTLEANHKSMSASRHLISLVNIAINCTLARVAGLIISLCVQTLAQLPALQNVNPLTNPTPGLANIWIDQNGGSCTRSGTRRDYAASDSSSCSSCQNAFNAASAGDVVILKNGTYSGDCDISGSPKASVVSFFAETRELAIVRDLIVQVDKIHVSGVISSGTGNSRRFLETHATLDNWTDVVIDGYRGSHAFLEMSNTTVMNSEFGAAQGCEIIKATGDQQYEDTVRLWSPDGFNSVHGTFRNNIVHDYDAPPECTGTTSCPACAGAHTDCIQIFNTANGPLLIDGNKFYNCPTSGIMISSVDPVSNLTIQNNMMGNLLYNGSVNLISLNASNNTCSITVRNNFLNMGGMSDSTSCTSGGFSISGNIFPQAVTSFTGTYTGGFNVFPAAGGTTAGTNAKRCTPTWLNGTPSDANSWDIRLSSSDTCAKDAGNASSFAPLDIFGTSRPIGSVADAGAFEIGSGGSISNSIAPTISVSSALAESNSLTSTATSSVGVAAQADMANSAKTKFIYHGRR